jgi:chromosomal replication initiation ATPase DnaA
MLERRETEEAEASVKEHSPFCGCDECAPRAASGVRSSSPTVAKASGEYTVDQVVDAVSEVYQVTAADLKGRDRHRSIAEARNVAAWFAYKLTPLSYPEVGRALGGRDHTTIMTVTKSIERRLQKDQVLRGAAERVLALLDGEPERRTA